MLGKIINFQAKNNLVTINFKNGSGYVRVISSTILNFYLAKEKSYAIENLKTKKTSFTATLVGEVLNITTKDLTIVIKPDFLVDIYHQEQLLASDASARNPYVRSGIAFDIAGDNVASGEGHKTSLPFMRHNIEIVKKSFGDEVIYGLGEKMGFLNKMYYEYENYNTDNPDPHNEHFKTLYKSVPFFIVHRQCGNYGIFFDNTYKTYFDFMNENSSYYYFGADKGAYDYYFIFGEDIKQVVYSYSTLTGATPLPRRKALGHHQSRWSYGTKDTVEAIISKYKENNIPLDFIHLDIDYMDNYKVFTFNEERFPDINKFIKKLDEQGISVITIIDPGVKVEKDYFMYEEAISNHLEATLDGKTYINKVWPGDSIYPDFSNPKTQNWWKDKQKILLNNNVFGVWNDMNEPASFNGPLPENVKFFDGTHDKIHNVYGHLMSKATYLGLKEASSKRPFVITRACYAGSQKYTTFWTGDNHSLWHHLAYAIPMLCNMGLSGLTFVGTDIGGFGSDTTKELLIRWYQIGCFFPLFRNHSAMHTRNQEPFAFDNDTTKKIKNFIELRYQLIPYYYDLFYLHQTNYLPIFRPLVLNYPNDPLTNEINDQFMIGDDLLISPIVEQGKNTKTTYLPEGKWYDVTTQKLISGNKTILTTVTTSDYPMFIRSGAIIPLYPVMTNLKNQPDVLKVLFIPGKNKYIHYIDDGESFDYLSGKYSLLKFNGTSHSLESTVEHNNYPISYKTIEVYFFYPNTPKCTLDGREVLPEQKNGFWVVRTHNLNFKLNF